MTELTEKAKDFISNVCSASNNGLPVLIYRYVPPCSSVPEQRLLSFLSQAGTVRGRGRAGAGNRGPGPRGSYLGGYSAGRGIYSRYHEGKGKLPDKPYEIMSNLELAAVNPVGIKPGTSQCEIKPHTYRIKLCCSPLHPVEAESKMI